MRVQKRVDGGGGAGTERAYRKGGQRKGPGPRGRFKGVGLGWLEVVTLSVISRGWDWGEEWLVEFIISFLTMEY